METNAHHLVLGELEDYITGEIIADTLDERYRQKIARLLVEKCGFSKRDIEKSRSVKVNAGGKAAHLKLDFLVSVKGRASMLVRFAPGSLVTRRRSTVAMSRVITSWQVPVAVMTNGEDAEVLDGRSGLLMGSGLSAIPSLPELEKIVDGYSFEEVPEKLKDMALRIVYAFEVDGSCPCDTDICREE